MEKDNCECERKPVYLEELNGDEVVSINIVDGGHLYCRKIEIQFKSGKLLHMNSEIDVGPLGIMPRIRYGVGGWIEVNNSKKEKKQ